MVDMNHDTFAPRSSDEPGDATEPIPDIETFKLPFDTTEQLRQRWRALMGPLGFSEARLWVGIVDGDRMAPGVLPYLVLPTVPSARVIDLFLPQLLEATDGVAHLSLAFLLSRPGSDGITPRDLGWARLIADTAGRLGISVHPTHRANDVSLVTIPVPAESAA